MAERAVSSSAVVGYASMTSPLGDLWIARTARGLCRLAFGSSEEEWTKQLMGAMGATPRRDADALSEIIGQLAEYFSGSRRSFDVPLDLSRGSPFQQRVWAATGKIPYGQVRTYGEVAKAIGAPRATRAVGGALGSNPVPIVVPCHRVLRVDGSLGGFSAGLAVKKALLALEGHRQRH